MNNQQAAQQVAQAAGQTAAPAMAAPVDVPAATAPNVVASSKKKKK
jgi:hypothetical protein